MRPEGLDVNSDALHGEKVGVGTLTVLREYRNIINAHGISFKDYSEYNEEFIYKMFGDRLTGEIEKENADDCGKGITAEKMEKSFDRIKAVINELPESKQLEGVFVKLGIKSTFEDIDVSSDKLPLILEYSPCVRNRLTLMRLRKIICHS